LDLQIELNNTTIEQVDVFSLLGGHWLMI
jgi:hypothetical protein